LADILADKSEVLIFLRARGDWTSPAQIRAIIHVPERTLRNWLRDLVEKGSIELRGERKGRRYRLREET
jgi:DNA-binding transcriptional ArsR family regulator